LQKYLPFFCPVATGLQKHTLTIPEAETIIECVRDALTRKHKNAEMEFGILFQEATEMMRTIDSTMEISVKRQCLRQTIRSNVPADSPEEYYRRCVYIPVLDNILTDINCKFSKENLKCVRLLSLLAQNIQFHQEISTERLKELFEFLSPFTNKSMREFAGEVEIWRRIAVVEKKSREINNSLDALFICDSEQYPVIYLALHIFTTLAVSIATTERTFSTLRLLKNLDSKSDESRSIDWPISHIMSIVKSISIRTKLVDKFAAL